MQQDSIWEYFQTEQQQCFEGSRARLEFLADRVKKHGKVLNIGVGGGLFEEIAIGMGLDVHSLDPGERTIESIRARYSMADRARVGYSQEIPFPDCSFDAVVVSEVLEHLSDQTITDSLCEIHRILVPGGAVLGTVPAREDLSVNLVVCPDCNKVFHRWGHVQSFDVPRVAKVLRPYFDIRNIYERPFVTWSSLKLLSKAKALVKVVLSKIGIHSHDEVIFFMATKR